MEKIAMGYKMKIKHIRNKSNIKPYPAWFWKKILPMYRSSLQPMIVWFAKQVAVQTVIYWFLLIAIVLLHHLNSHQDSRIVIKTD